MVNSAEKPSLVTIISQHTLQRANDHSFPHSTVNLGPLDQLVHPAMSIAVVFVYMRSESSGSKPIQAERLQRALALLLDYYPHLTGHLQVDPVDGTYRITGIGTGAKLLVAQCSEHLDAFRSTQGRLSLLDLPGSGNALLAPYNPNFPKEPIFTIQYTSFVCGSISLGIRLPHAVCAADGYLKLMSNLAELYRGLQSNDSPTLTRQPHICSYMSEPEDMTPEEKQAALSYQPSLFYLEPSDRSTVEKETTSTTNISPPPVTGRVLHFSASQLESLKAYATDPNGEGHWVTTYESLCALLHQSIYRARLQLQGTLDTPDFLTPVNVINTPRGLADIPPTYFPNNFLCVHSTFSHQILADGPLWQVAKQLHNTTRSDFLTAQEVKRTVQWIAAQPDKGRIRHAFRYANSLMMSSWTKFDMYAGTEFEEGEKPVLIGLPFTLTSSVDGLGYALPGADKGAVDVYLALSEPLWEILQKDEHLRQFSSEWPVAKSDSS